MNYATPPGDTLREILKFRGITQTAFAQRIKRPLKTVNEIIQARAAITPETALQLERALRVPAEFWMSLETNYRLSRLRRKAASEK